MSTPSHSLARALPLSGVGYEFSPRQEFLWTLLTRLPVEDAIAVLVDYTHEVNEDRVADGEEPYAPLELLEVAFSGMADNQGDMTREEGAADLEEKIADARVMEVRNHATSYIDQLHFLLTDRLEGIDPDEELDDWREMAEIVRRSESALAAMAGLGCPQCEKGAEPYGANSFACGCLEDTLVSIKDGTDGISKAEAVKLVSKGEQS